MNSSAHQRHAGHCRHAKSTEAKRKYHRQLSAKFELSSHKSDLRLFVSKMRAAAQRESIYFGFSVSTLHTWIREWKTAAMVGV